MTVSNQPKKTLSGYYAETNILIQSIIANGIQINTFNTAGVVLNTSDGTLYTSTALPITLGGTGVVGGLTSPGPIGSVAAGTGAFTTLTTSNNTSTYASASVTFTNTNGSPNACMAVLGPNMGSGNEVALFVGQALSTGNSAQSGFVYVSNNSASNYAFYCPHGGITKMKLFSATPQASINAPFTSSSTLTGTQLISNIAIGTAPIVVTSTTLVALLYVARSALADTVTTNANLSGVITSGGNVTSFTNGSTGSGAVVLQTSPTVSTLTVSSGGIHQVAGDLVIDVGAVTLGAGSIGVTLGAITASVGDITSGVWPVAYSKISPLSIYSTGSITTLGNATHLGLTVAAAASIGTTLSVIGLTDLAATNVAGSFSAIGLFNVISPFAITLNATGAAEDILIEASGAASNIQLLANGAGIGTITIETAGATTGDISIIGNVFDCANV